MSCNNSLEALEKPIHTSRLGVQFAERLPWLEWWCKVDDQAS